jgi:hypothetical protein
MMNAECRMKRIEDGRSRIEDRKARAVAAASLRHLLSSIF